MSDFTKNSKLWNWSCKCESRAGCAMPIPSAHALKNLLGDSSRLLDFGIEPFKMIAPEFQKSVATTMGGLTLMTEYGRIAEIQGPGDAFTCPEDMIVIRTAHNSNVNTDKCVTGMSNSDLETRRPPALYVFDHVGTVVHRIDVLEADDASILAAACGSLHEWEGASRLFEVENEGALSSSNVTSLQPHVEMRSGWENLEISKHFDYMLQDGGRQRARMLERLHPKQARRTNPQVLSHFLRYLVQHNISFTQAIVRPGIMQAHRGIADFINFEDGLLFIYADEAMTVIDYGAVADVWIVKYQWNGERQLMLEFYDADNLCLGVLACDPERPGHGPVSWDLLVASLPNMS